MRLIGLTAQDTRGGPLVIHLTPTANADAGFVWTTNPQVDFKYSTATPIYLMNDPREVEVAQFLGSVDSSREWAAEDLKWRFEKAMPIASYLERKPKAHGVLTNEEFKELEETMAEITECQQLERGVKKREELKSIVKVCAGNYDEV